MALFEDLYGRRCTSPICWDNNAEAVVLGPHMLQDMIEQVKVIGQKIKAAQDRQKSFADLHCRDIEFQVGDKILLKVSDMRGVIGFEVPKEILDRNVRKTRSGETVLLKVLWSNHNVEEATWKGEEAMKEHYPSLFAQLS
ncbi:uncharacterized protein LOC141631554 [Silene latifolia]|uniref:uncharacterized protein LOC141631554 n=1 Tax=Silene latifolia TaxID=37657 RepID=UPI003D7787E4